MIVSPISKRGFIAVCIALFLGAKLGLAEDTGWNFHSKPSGRKWIEVRLQAIILEDDDGSRPARVKPEQIEKWIEFANQTFAAACIRFLFDREKDVDRLQNTSINNLASDQDPGWNAAKAAADHAASRYPDRLVIVFRHGPGPQGTGAGFSGPGYHFVAMPGWEDARHCDHPHTDALAHEIGHYLGLGHTFPRPQESLKEAARYLKEHGNDPNAFDGDGLADTPPDPSIRFTECDRVKSITVGEQTFRLPRHNIMSYYDERDELSPQQIQRVRWFLNKRRENGMALPTNLGARHPLEAESLKIVEEKDCPHQVQTMTGFGLGTWSGNAQLFCQPRRGGFVTLQFDVTKTARYRLSLFATLAPDYGRMETLLDGKKIGRTINGFAPGVYESGRIRLGSFALRAGPHHLTLRAVSKEPASANYHFGIDLIDLEPE